MTAVLAAFPSTPRARVAYTNLRRLVPGELAARAVRDLERACTAQERAAVLAALPELPITEHQIFLDVHGYNDCCVGCYRRSEPARVCRRRPRHAAHALQAVPPAPPGARECRMSLTAEEPSALELERENALREVQRLQVVVADREEMIARLCAKVAILESATVNLGRVLDIAQRYGLQGASNHNLTEWLTQRLGCAEALAQAVERAMPLALTHYADVRVADPAWQLIVSRCRAFKAGG